MKLLLSTRHSLVLRSGLCRDCLLSWPALRFAVANLQTGPSAPYPMENVDAPTFLYGNSSREVRP